MEMGYPQNLVLSTYLHAGRHRETTEELLLSLGLPDELPPELRGDSETGDGGDST